VSHPDLSGEAVAAELCLLDPVVRRDPVAVASLLDEAFVEVGRSGRVLSRSDVLALLAAETRPSTPTLLEGPAAEPLAPGIALVRYRAHTSAGVSRHISLWLAKQGAWRCRFHQGIVESEDPAPTAEPSSSATLTTT
jgi:ribonuclease HI